MKRSFKFLLVISATLLATACGKGAKEKKGSLGDLKVKLETKKKERTKIETEIRELETQIAKLDPQAAAQQTSKLVAVDTVRKSNFEHYIELQAKVDAYDIVMVTPRGMPSQVKALYIKRGDVVRKGQLLAKLDDAVLVQQMEALKVQLAYAENLYNRQKNLWDQGIGTEVQLVTAKNNVDAIKRQMGTLGANWQTSFVYSPISGVADEVNLRVGETFTGGSQSSPQIRIVNAGSLKAVAEVPENYVAKVRKGDKVAIVVPETGRSADTAVISMVGATIHPTNRSFTIEAKLPANPFLKPNQAAVLKILDYQSKAAIAVPVDVVQTDEKGKYVYVVEKSGDRLIARKKSVNVGEAYSGKIEIKSGLTGGELIITEGYQLVYDGQTVTIGV